MEMVPPPPAQTPGGTHNIERAAWLNRLEHHGRVHGYHRPLDSRHGALFTEDDDVLLVSFEDAATIRRSAVGLPAALDVAGREGWSQLCLYSEGDTFFRAPAIYHYFDKLVDDGFFDQFDRVVFFGSGPGAYAAATYSVTAPGATVVLVRPLATLDPALTEWDDRYRGLRRTDFTRRYGYAPEMIEAAGEVFGLYDPHVSLDAMHMALFDLPEENRLRCRHLGPALEFDLAEMGVLGPLLRAAGRGVLDAETFHDLYRRRRDYRPYLHRILTHLRAEHRTGLCRHWANGVRARLSDSGKTKAAG